MQENYFMGLDGFVWFTGGVEDRQDPKKLGRVRVRVLGMHTEDLTKIPTTDLPWAHIMHPVTNPSMQGLGDTPTFIVEGTWVVGFFLDAVEKQQPLIIGSLPGYPQNVADTSKGFNDPIGKYPSSSITHSDHSTKESDVNRLARGLASETHLSLKNRRVRRTTSVPTAGKPGLTNSQDFSTATADGGTWNEPHPKSVQSDTNPYPSSLYPYNHVFESESGHIFEIDDTPDYERLYKEHMSGTFEEIHPHGTRVVKVVYDDYEIVARNKKIVINASKSSAASGLDLTVNGAVKQKITGDYILDIGGNFIRRVGKNEIVKVGAGGSGNMETEILGSYNINVNRNYIATIGNGANEATDGNLTVTVTGKEERTINKTQDITVLSDISVTSLTASISQTAFTDFNITGLSTMNVISAGTTSHGSSGDVTINYETSLSETVGSGGITQTTSGSVTESYGSLATTISGVTGIKYGGDATHHYVGAFKEKIDGDTFVDKAGGQVSHVHPVSPARTSGTDPVT